MKIYTIVIAATKDGRAHVGAISAETHDGVTEDRLRRHAMETCLEQWKPSDGFDGHQVLLHEVPHWQIMEAARGE